MITTENNINWKQNTHVIEVPEFKLSVYEKLLKKLNRFSKTINIPTPISEKISTKLVYLIYDGNSIIKRTSNISEIKSLATIHEGMHIRQIHVHTFNLTIVDEIKPIDEWELLGTIDYIDSLVKNAPNKTIPFELYRDMKLSGNSECDHCNKTIYRNKTVFVKNMVSNEIKHIGGTCTKYYLGLDYERLLSYIESLHVMESISTEYGDSTIQGDAFEKLFDITDIIKYYIWHTNHKGHTSNKQAVAYNEKVECTTKHKLSTGHIVSDMIEYVSYMPDTNFKSEDEIEIIMDEWENTCNIFSEQISTISDQSVQEILDFIESKKEESTFMFNVSNKVADGSVNDRLIKYITGACSFYFSVKSYEENKEKLKEHPSSNHIGEVDSKVGFQDIEVTRVSGFEGAFGWTNIYNMKDQRGNVIVKFGTINEKFITSNVDGEDNIVVGTKLSFVAPIVEHSEFNGTKQTKIGRLSKFNSKLTY